MRRLRRGRSILEMRDSVAKSFHPPPSGRGAGVRANDGGSACSHQHFKSPNVKPDPLVDPTPLVNP